MSNENDPVVDADWFEAGDRDETALTKLLDYAANGYKNHTDWFLRHRDAGLRQLGALLAAEILVLRLFQDAPSTLLPAIALLMLAPLALVLARSASASCGRSFLAAMEHVAVTSKTAWALTGGGRVGIDLSRDPTGPPFVRDNTVFVPRYLEGARQFDSTQDFTREHLRSRNTLFWARVAIWSLAWGGFALGIFLGVFLLLAEAPVV